MHTCNTISRLEELVASTKTPEQRRERYVEYILELLLEVGMTRAQLDHKIDEQLQTMDGLDSLNFNNLEKVIMWLENKLESKRNAA
jgi:hypothetical protein